MGCARGGVQRCVASLTRDGAAQWTAERVEAMRVLHPRGPHVLPLCPEDAPHSIFDKVEVAKLVGRWQRSTAAGPSGWTAELLAPLLGDDSCLEIVTLLVQLIANDDLD